MTSNRNDTRLDGLTLGERWIVEHQDGMTIIAERGDSDEAPFWRVAPGGPLNAAFHTITDRGERIAELEAELRAVHEGGVFTAGEMDAAVVSERQRCAKIAANYEAAGEFGAPYAIMGEAPEDPRSAGDRDDE